MFHGSGCTWSWSPETERHKGPQDLVEVEVVVDVEDALMVVVVVDAQDAEAVVDVEDAKDEGDSGGRGDSQAWDGALLAMSTILLNRSVGEFRKLLTE